MDSIIQPLSNWGQFNKNLIINIIVIITIITITTLIIIITTTAISKL